MSMDPNAAQSLANAAAALRQQAAANLLDRPFPYAVIGQVRVMCGVGLCDPVLASNTLAIQVGRYDTVFFQFSLIATVIPGGGGAQRPAGTDGCNLLLANQQNRSLFLNGPGDGTTVAGGWQIISDVFSDNFKGGATVDRGWCFIGVGLAIRTTDAVQRGGTGASASDPIFRSQWLKNAIDGSGYSYEAQKAVEEWTTITLQYGDAGKVFKLGKSVHWPSPFGTESPWSLRSSGFDGPYFFGFPISACFGSRDDSFQGSFTAVVGTDYVIQNDETNPSIAGSVPGTAGTINAANNGTVFVPYEVFMFGFPICCPAADLCGYVLDPYVAVNLQRNYGIAPVATPATAPVAGLPGGNSLTRG